MPRSFEYVIGPSGTALTQAQVDNNILCIMDNLVGQYGWTKQAAAGACGCFYEESMMNPGIYETSHGGNLSNLPYFPGGMGLAQWTDYPAYSSENPNPLPWCAQKDSQLWYDGNFQCFLMTKATDPAYTDLGLSLGPMWGWLTSSSYPSIPFSQFTSWTGSISDAVTYWFYDFEWHWDQIPSWVDFPARVAWGQYAYDLMQGETPQPPGPIPTPYPGSVTGFVAWCKDKCDDPDVQYSQPNREEVTINGITYYDCSSFVWYGLKHNNFDVDQTGHPNRAFTTSEMPADLLAMGFTEIDRSGEIKPGDIGWTSTHAEVCYSGGSGQGVFMGAHDDTLPAADQVSVNNFASAGTDFERIYRFYSTGPGPTPTPSEKGKKLLWMYMRNWPYRIY